MQKNRSRTITAILISICLAGAGCTTTRTVPVPRSDTARLASRIEPGTRIIVTLRSGQTRSFRVTAVESDAVVGGQLRIPLADIEKIQAVQIRKISVARTAGVIAAVAAVAFGLWVHHQATKDGNES
jgi:hypothetical protein